MVAKLSTKKDEIWLKQWKIKWLLQIMKYFQKFKI